MMIRETRRLWSGLFLLGGAMIGYFYYRFVGCTGGCVITSDPLRSMIYMGAVGGLIGAVIRKETP